MSKKLAFFICVMLVAVCLTAGCSAGIPTDKASEPSEEVLPNNLEKSETPAVSPAQPIVTTTLSETPKPTLTPKPTPRPTVTPKPTPEPTPEPTVTPKPYEVYEISAGSPFQYDVNGDGTEESILLSFETDEYAQSCLHISINDEQPIVVDNCSNCVVYLYSNTSGQLVLLISFDAGSDDYLTYAYRFMNEKPVQTGVFNGYVQDFGAAGVTLEGPIFTLGTWIAQCQFRLNDASELVPSDDGLWYIQRREYDEPLIVAKDLPVEILSNGKYEQKTLSPGTKILPLATDNVTVVIFELENGTQGKLAISRESYMVMIQGAEDIEWFDNIVYYG